MMGIRYDRVNGFYGPRRWNFDIDEFLQGLFYVSALAFLATAGWAVWRLLSWS